MTGLPMRIAAAVSAVVVGAAQTPIGHAEVNPALNGVFTATSDGQWAKKNEILYRQATVVSTWTITSSCTNAYSCTGTVTSDQGWTADIKYIAQMWFVTRTLDNWEPCPDGTALPGKQIFKFHEHSNYAGTYMGWDTATGPSGACGINKALFIEIPFTLVPK